MKIKLIIVFLVVLVIVPFAVRWPVDNIVLTATFGENRGDHFHSGIDLAGGEQAIYPMDDGELVFYFEEDEYSNDIPTGLGSFVVLEHPRGIRSVYTHLKKNSMIRKDIYTQDDIIGLIGETGGSIGKHLHFEVIDMQFGHVVNPLIPLPPLADYTDPVINTVKLVNSKSSYTLYENTSIPAGSYKIILELQDQSQWVKNYYCPMAPYKINMFLNGEEIVFFSLDKLIPENGRQVMSMSDDFAFNDLYIDKWQISVGELVLSQARSKLKLIVDDFAGNETSKNYIIN